MAGAIPVDRADWLGYRWHQHGLGGGSGEDPPDEPLLDKPPLDKARLDDLLMLGVQDSGQVAAEQSLVQRTSRIGRTSLGSAISRTGPLVTMWSVRGAPHAHRVTHLDFVRDALAPQESDDAGAAYVDAVREVAAVLTAVVTAPTPKSTASTEVTARVSGSLVTRCARCASDHVPDGLFRAAGRQARLLLGRDDARTTVLCPPPSHRQTTVENPRLSLLAAYLRVNGPTTKTLYRDWLQGGSAAIADLWAQLGEVVRVAVDGRRYDLPEALLAKVAQAERPRGAALVPPHDPYLRQTDRTLLVPDRKRRGEVWRALSPPGALLVDGEVAGTWRYRRSDDAVSITTFEQVTPAHRTAAERSARRMADVDEHGELTITWQ